MDTDLSGTSTVTEETDSEESGTDATIPYVESEAEKKVADQTLASIVCPKMLNGVIKPLQRFQDEL